MKVICCCSSGLSIKGQFKKLNAVLDLTDADCQEEQVKALLEKGLLRPVESQEPEVMKGGQLEIVAQDEKGTTQENDQAQETPEERNDDENHDTAQSGSDL